MSKDNFALHSACTGNPKCRSACKQNDLQSKIEAFFVNHPCPDSNQIDSDYLEAFGSIKHTEDDMRFFLSFFQKEDENEIQEWGDFAAFAPPEFWTRGALCALVEHQKDALNMLQVTEDGCICTLLALKYYLYGSASFDTWTRDNDDNWGAWAWEQLAYTDPEGECELKNTMIELNAKYEDGHPEQLKRNLDALHRKVKLWVDDYNKSH